MEHVLYVFATVQVKTAHFSLHLLTMLTPHQAFSISETQSVPKICQQMPVCQILKQKEQISMECTNGKNRVFPFVLFFCIALGIRVLKSICTHINTAYIHTYVRIYIYIYIYYAQTVIILWCWHWQIFAFKLDTTLGLHWIHGHSWPGSGRATIVSGTIARKMTCAVSKVAASTLQDVFKVLVVPSLYCNPLL